MVKRKTKKQKIATIEYKPIEREILENATLSSGFDSIEEYLKEERHKKQSKITMILTFATVIIALSAIVNILIQAHSIEDLFYKILLDAVALIMVIIFVVFIVKITKQKG